MNILIKNFLYNINITTALFLQNEKQIGTTSASMQLITHLRPEPFKMNFKNLYKNFTKVHLKFKIYFYIINNSYKYLYYCKPI